MSEPLKYVAKERCACGQEEATPADWDLVRSKQASLGEFLIRNEQGQMWHHMPFRLGGCAQRDRAVEGFAAPPQTPAVAETKPEGGDTVTDTKLTDIAEKLGVRGTSLRAKLLRAGIPLVRKGEAFASRILIVPAEHVERALELGSAIQPRPYHHRRRRGITRKRKEAALAKDAKALRKLLDKGLISPEEHLAASRKLDERLEPRPPAGVPVVSPARSGHDADTMQKVLQFVRTVLEKNNISELHFAEGRLTARKTITTSETLEA